MRDFRLSTPCKWDARSTVIWCALYCDLMRALLWFDARSTVIWCALHCDLMRALLWFDARSTVIWCALYCDLMRALLWFDARSTVIWCALYCDFTQHIPAIVFTETSVRNYHSTLRRIPKSSVLIIRVNSNEICYRFQHRHTRNVNNVLLTGYKQRHVLQQICKIEYN